MCPPLPYASASMAKTFICHKLPPSSCKVAATWCSCVMPSSTAPCWVKAQPRSAMPTASHRANPCARVRNLFLCEIEGWLCLPAEEPKPRRKFQSIYEGIGMRQALGQGERLLAFPHSPVRITQRPQNPTRVRETSNSPISPHQGDMGAVFLRVIQAHHLLQVSQGSGKLPERK